MQIFNNRYFWVLATAVLLMVVGATTLGIWPFSRTFVERLPEEMVKELVTRSLELPPDQRVEYLWRQLDNTNINAFLVQSYWSFFLNMQSVAWSRLDQRYSQPASESLNQEGIAALAYFRCVSDLHLGMTKRCWNGATPFPQQKIEMMLMAFVKSLKIREASRIYEVFLKNDAESCPMKAGNDKMSAHSVSRFFNLLNRIEPASNCILSLIQNTTGSLKTFLEIELILIELMHRKKNMEAPEWKRFQSVKNTPFYQYHLLLAQSGWFIRKKDFGKIPTILSQMESLLEDSEMKHHLDQVKYIKENLEVPASRLPKATSYETWVARKLLEN